MRKLGILAVVMAVLLVGVAGVLAGNRDVLIKVNMPASLGQTLYSRSELIPRPEYLEPVQLPTPVGPNEATTMKFAQKGPVAVNHTHSASFAQSQKLSSGMGGMLAPRGSAMASPKMRADREIRVLIRRLD